jgi:hypothetical protein
VRLHFPHLGLPPIQSATLKPYVIANEVGLGEKQYFDTYGGGLEGTALLFDDLSAKLAYEIREKNFTNAVERPLSRGLTGTDNLFILALNKPVTANSALTTEFDFVDQSTRAHFFTNKTYAISAGYRIRYDDPLGWLNLPWETSVFGSRSWSIYAAPDPCCVTGVTAGINTFSPPLAVRRHPVLPDQREHRAHSAGAAGYRLVEPAHLRLHQQLIPGRPANSFLGCRSRSDGLLARLLRALPAIAAVMAMAATAIPAEAQKVGVNSAVNPDATGTPPGGATRKLVLGQEVVHNEHVVTGPQGQTQILFLDESAMTVGPSADVTIDEFVYDPNTGNGRLAMSATQGVMRFVGGRLSKSPGCGVAEYSGGHAWHSRRRLPAGFGAELPIAHHMHSIP